MTPRIFLATIAGSLFGAAVIIASASLTRVSAVPPAIQFLNSPVEPCVWDGEGYVETFDDTRWEDSLAEGVR